MMRFRTALLASLVVTLGWVGVLNAQQVGDGIWGGGGGGGVASALVCLLTGDVGCTMTGGIVFSGVSSDITTGTNEDLTFAPNGTGTIVLAAGSTGIIKTNIGTGTTRGEINTVTGSITRFLGAGAGGSVGSNTTIAATVPAVTIVDSRTTVLAAVYGEGIYKTTATQSAACAAGVLALDPQSSVIYIDANTAACVVTLAETTATTVGAGFDVLIVLTANVSGAVTFPNVGGVHAGPAACTTAGLTTLGSTYRIHYASTLAEYVGVSCNSN